MKKILLLFIFLFSFFLFTPVVLAQGLVIENNIKEINLIPSGAEHFFFKVKNNTDGKIDVKTIIKSFKFNSNEGEIELINDDNNLLVKDWLRPSNSASFSLSAHSEYKAVFLVTIPRQVENKGYYAAIFFVGTNSNNQKITSNNGLLLLGVEKEDFHTQIREGHIKSLNVLKKNYYGPVNINIKFENTGKIHYKISGKIEIFNIFNKKVVSLPLEKKNILPGAIISLNLNWKRKYFIGKYLIVAKTIDGDGNESFLTAQFWAFPWKEIIIICFIIFLLFLAKKLKNKKLLFE